MSTDDNETLLTTDVEGGETFNGKIGSFPPPPPELAEQIENIRRAETEEISSDRYLADAQLIAANESDPFVLKGHGDRFWSEGDLDSALIVWRKSLVKYFSTAMKVSEGKSTPLRDLGIALRNNIGFLHQKREEFTDAIEQYQISINQESYQPKIQVRVLACYVEMKSTRKALEVADEMIAEFMEKGADDKYVRLTKYYKNKVIESERNDREGAKLNMKMFGAVLRKGDEEIFNQTPAETERELIQKEQRVPIRWGCDEVDDPSRDDFIFNDFLDVENGPAADQSRQSWFSVPLTVLRMLHILILGDDPTGFAEHSVLSWTYHHNPKISPSKTRGLNVQTSPVQRAAFARMLRRPVDQGRPLTVHVINQNGILSDLSDWRVLLQRLPAAGNIQIVNIGYTGIDDLVGSEMSAGELEMDRPLYVEGGRRVDRYKFKGEYFEFLYNCQTVKPDKKWNELSDHLPTFWEQKHPLYPDLIVCLQPNPTNNFTEKANLFDFLGCWHVPFIVTGYSTLPTINGEDVEGSKAPSRTHEFRFMPAWMNAFRATQICNWHWNPFSVRSKAPEDEDAGILTFSKYDNEGNVELVRRRRDDAVHAAVAAYWGGRNVASPLSQHYKFLRKSEILQIREDLQSLHVDVSSEEEIIRRLRSSLFDGRGGLDRYRADCESALKSKLAKLSG